MSLLNAFRPGAASLRTPDELPDPNTPLISLRDLEKSYPVAGGQVFVLRRITFDVMPGEFVSVMGPSGAGKSTLLGILGMLDHAWSGEYYFLGHPVHALPPKQRIALNKRH